MKILIVLTSHDRLGATGRKTGFYLSELTHPLEVFSAAGFEVQLASPKGGLPPMDGLDPTDETNRAFLEDARWMTRLASTASLDAVNPSDYDAVFVPGGHGTMFDLPDDLRLAGILGALYDQGGIVSAVCHGPAALVNAQRADGHALVDGHEVTGFTNDEEAAAKLTDTMPFLLETRLRERGGVFKKAPNFKPNVVVSGRLVTGQNPASARGVAEALVKLLAEARPTAQGVKSKAR